MGEPNPSHPVRGHEGVCSTSEDCDEGVEWHKTDSGKAFIKKCDEDLNIALIAVSSASCARPYALNLGG